MKLAYMIQAHKNLDQILLLISSLKDCNIDLFIHIDKKNDSLLYELKEKLKNNSNIYFVEDRIDVIWGGFSQVRATLKLLELVLKSVEKYDYISFISGQDYPIKSKEYIRSFLERNRGREFIEAIPIEQYYWRIKFYNLFSDSRNKKSVAIRAINKFLRIFQKTLSFSRRNLMDLELYVGSSWFTITPDCADYIIKYLKDNPAYLRDFKYTVCPDEHFFQIIVMNSGFKDRVINDDLRYIDWSEGKSNPKLLTMSDFNSLINSDKLIARKFDINTDKEIIERLNEHISLYAGHSDYL